MVTTETTKAQRVKSVERKKSIKKAKVIYSLIFSFLRFFLKTFKFFILWIIAGNFQNIFIIMSFPND